MEKRFTPEDVAERLGVSRRTVYRHIKRGKLPATQPAGWNYLITRSDLIRYLGGEDRYRELFDTK